MKLNFLRRWRRFPFGMVQNRVTVLWRRTSRSAGSGPADLEVRRHRTVTRDPGKLNHAFFSLFQRVLRGPFLTCPGTSADRGSSPPARLCGHLHRDAPLFPRQPGRSLPGVGRLFPARGDGASVGERVERHGYRLPGLGRSSVGPGVPAVLGAVVGCAGGCSLETDRPRDCSGLAAAPEGAVGGHPVALVGPGSAAGRTDPSPPRQQGRTNPSPPRQQGRAGWRPPRCAPLWSSTSPEQNYRPCRSLPEKRQFYFGTDGRGKKGKVPWDFFPLSSSPS